MSDWGTEIMRGNPDALACWERSCKAAPYLSDKPAPWYVGDLVWPDGNDKSDMNTMLCWDGLDWRSLSEPIEYRVATQIKGVTVPPGFRVYGSEGQ